MKLYHFTAKEYLDDILADGLSKGEVPVTQSHLMNAVWLTSNGDPAGHGLTDGRELSDAEKTRLGAPLDQPAFFPDKRAIRLTVMIPRGDRNLVPWPRWGRKRLAPDWYATLDRIGGGKSRTWFLYWGVIPSEWISAAENLREGTVLPLPARPNAVARVRAPRMDAESNFPDELRPLEDLRRTIAPEELADLVPNLAQAEVVRADYGDPENGGQFLKGKEKLQAVVDTNRGVHMRLVELRVANTRQIELLKACLAFYSDGKFTAQIAEQFARALSVAATVPGGMHDDVGFEAAMARALRQQAGSA